MGKDGTFFNRTAAPTALIGFAAYLGMREIAVPELVEYAQESMRQMGQAGLTQFLAIPMLVGMTVVNYIVNCHKNRTFYAI